MADEIRTGKISTDTPEFLDAENAVKESIQIIIETKETPLFDTFMKFGWHLSMRESLKHMGYIKENRAPFNNATNTQLETIINTLNKIL